MSREQEELHTPLRLARMDGYVATFEGMARHAHTQRVPGDGQPLARINLQDETFAVALMRAWAVVGDVLAFYQARFAEQGYVDTADAASKVDLERTVGGRPMPKPAAQARVSFSATATPAINAPLTVPKGTPIRAIDGSGAVQIYETFGEVGVHAEGNEIAVLPWTAPCPIVSGDGRYETTLEGTGLGLRAGDLLLITRDARGDIDARLATVSSAVESAREGTTKLTWVGEAAPDAAGFHLLGRPETLYGARAPDWGSLSLATRIQYSPMKGGIAYRSTDEALPLDERTPAPPTETWPSFNDGLPTPTVSDPPITALVYDAKIGFVAASPAGVLIAPKKGASWRLASGAAIPGEVTAVLVDDGVIYAGTPAGKVYRSIDCGAHWDPVIGTYQVTDQEPSPTSGSGSGSGTGPLSTSGGGTTWYALSTNLPPAVVRGLIWFDDRLFAATDDGFYSTALDGKGWSLELFEIMTVPEDGSPGSDLPTFQGWASTGTALWAAFDGALYRYGPSLSTTSGSGLPMPVPAPAILGLFGVDDRVAVYYDADGLHVSRPDGTWMVVGKSDLDLGSIRLATGFGESLFALGPKPKLEAGSEALFHWSPWASWEAIPRAPENVESLWGGPEFLVAVSPCAGTIDTDWPEPLLPIANWASFDPVVLELSRPAPAIVPQSRAVVTDGEGSAAVFEVLGNSTVRRQKMMQPSTPVSELSLQWVGSCLLERPSYRTASVLPVIRSIERALLPLIASPEGCWSLRVPQIFSITPDSSAAFIVGKAPRLRLDDLFDALTPLRGAASLSEATSSEQAALRDVRAQVQEHRKRLSDYEAKARLKSPSLSVSPIAPPSIVLPPPTSPLLRLWAKQKGSLDGLPLLPALTEDPTITETIAIESIQSGSLGDSPSSSVINLKSPLVHRYDSQTLAVHLNVVEVTHGKTVKDERLGSGDPSAAFQSFALAQGPLTHVALRGAPGPQTTLQVCVDGAPWTEVPSFVESGPASTHYMVRLDEDQRATVIFGDGEFGARLPRGVGNVTATYRASDPNSPPARARNISFWDSRPMGLERVKNPLDAQKPSGIPPKPVRRHDALDRAITVDDVATMARGLVGIAAAEAVLEGGAVLLRVAPEAGADPFRGKAREQWVRRMKDYFCARKGFAAPIHIEVCEPASLRFKARLLVRKSALREPLSEALQERFAYGKLAPGHTLSHLELLRGLQGPSGVLGVVSAEILQGGDGSQTMYLDKLSVEALPEPLGSAPLWQPDEAMWEVEAK